MTHASVLGSSAGVSALILCAMDEEAAPFLEVATNRIPVATPFKDARAERLTLDGREVVLVTSGIGLVAAASAVTWAVGEFAPAIIVSAGSCGGLSAESRVGNVAVSTDCTYGTADATEFGYERGQVPRQPVRFPASQRLVDAAVAASQTTLVGRILSGDTFVTARNVADMREAFPDAVATDMESCAIAQVALAVGREFVSVRGVSDLCGPAAGIDFHIGVDVAAARSADAVRGMLAAL